jgi:hypothetical protein
MNRQLSSLLLCFAALACSASGQQSSTAALKVKSAARPAEVSAAAAEVLEFERTMEAAVVRGDVAYVDRVSAPDLSFTHGDGSPMSRPQYGRRQTYVIGAVCGLVAGLIGSSNNGSTDAIKLAIVP